MYNKKLYEELAYKFSYLSNLKPDGVETKFDLLDIGLSDKFVQKFSPLRYGFYMNLLKALSNPNILKNVLYENKLIKINKEQENADVEEILNMIKRLYAIPTEDFEGKTEQEYNKMKQDKVDTVNTELKNRLKFAMRMNYGENNSTNDTSEFLENLLSESDESAEAKRKKKEEEDKRKKEEEAAKKLAAEEAAKAANAANPTGSTNRTNVTGSTNSTNATGSTNLISPRIRAPSRGGNLDFSEMFGGVDQNELDDYTKNIQELQKDFKKKGLNKYTDLLKKELDSGDNSTIKAQKLQDILFELEDDQQYSIKKFDLTKEDKLVFIGTTFVIRMLTLMIIDWSMTSNFIVSFYEAYLLYIGLYCIFLLLIMVIVNMTYIMPIQKLYTENTFASNIANIFYFFYLVPGKMLSSSLRLGVHIGVIVLMTVIALFIVYSPQNKELVISYDYTEKRNIRTQLNNFTLILWLFTSFLAMYYRS
jgi:hypothetical protein